MSKNEGFVLPLYSMAEALLWSKNDVIFYDYLCVNKLKMCYTVEFVKMLESFRESWNVLQDYKVTLRDRSFIIGKITDIVEDQAAEEFHDPETNEIWDSKEDMVLKLFVVTPTSSDPIEIGWRDISNIESLSK